MTSADTLGHRTTRFFFRRYKSARQYFSTRRPDVFTRAFFGLRYRLQTITTSRKLTRLDRLERMLWKQIYFQRFGAESLFSVDTDRPVATESPDHKWPRGTAFDNSSNRDFNRKLYAHFNFRPDLRVMDLGCSGGGFVKSFLEDGYSAVGLEGSDWSKKLRSAEWDTIPHHLLTCDITSHFQVRNRDGSPLAAHCVTAWEVLEHIPTDKLPTLFENVARHLAPDGIFVASVDTAPDANPVTGAVYHATLQPRAWWLQQMAVAGLTEVDNHIFTTRDYVRGHGMGLTDWDPADGEGFHVVMRRA